MDYINELGDFEDKKAKAKSEREKKEKEEEDKTRDQSQSHEGRKPLSDHVTEQISEMASQIQKVVERAGMVNRPTLT